MFNLTFSDVFGKSATAILDYMLEHPDEKNFDVTPFVDRRCKTPIEEIQLSIDGIISHEQAEKLKVIRAHMDTPEICKLNLESAILTLVEPYLPQVELIASVPGIRDFSVGLVALALISNLF